MLLSIGILIFAAALGISAVIFRKKIGNSWMISAIAAAIALVITGGTMMSSVFSLRNSDRMYVYCALEYLRAGHVDDASYYIKKTSGGDTKKDRFVQLGTQTVLEQMRGNELIARLRLDAMKGIYEAEEYQLICLKAEAVTPDNYDARETAVDALEAMLNLKGKALETAQNRYQAENSYYSFGYDSSGELSTLSQADQYKARINASLRQRDFMNAIMNAAQLVDLKASADNRMLLAETIAEAVYEGFIPNGEVFVTQPDQKQTSVDEMDKLMKKNSEAQSRFEDLQLIFNNTEDEKQKNELQKKLDAQQKILEESSEQMTNLFVYRALSSIADIHSTQADIVRARLAYAIRDYESAIDAVSSAANSLGARLTGDTTLRNAYGVFRSTHKGGDTLGIQSVEYKEALKTILTNGAIDMVGVNSSGLTNAFVDSVVAELKTYGENLFITSVNTDNFPEIVVTLSGRDTVIDAIRDNKGLLVRDSHSEVQYTVHKPDKSDINSIVCCVVDESGSMGGPPILDLKTALESFVDAMPETTKLGILGFDDSIYEIAAIGSSRPELHEAIGKIDAFGGTNISLGISAAVDACNMHQGRKTVLLMTDGQSSIDMNVVENAAREGITINTIGFGDVNSALLTEIAERTGGQYIHADSSAELSNIYMSLVGLIDNEIEIHYTVKYNKDDAVNEGHYVFIRSEKNGDTVRKEYQIPEVIHEFALNYVEPATFNTADLQLRDTVAITLYGERLDLIKTIQLNGKTVIPDESSSGYIRISVPSSQLKDGWQEITLTDDAGTLYEYDQALATGEEIWQQYYIMGNLTFNSTDGVLLNDGTLVLNHPVIYDNNTQMIDMNVSGLVSLKKTPGVSIGKDNGDMIGNIQLPDSGTWVGFGHIEYWAGQLSIDVNHYDGKEVYNGAFSLECSTDKVRLQPLSADGN